MLFTVVYIKIIFNIILVLFSVYIFYQTKIAATHCHVAGCGLRPLPYALFCNKLTLDEKHLQQYLDEFCYRFNRRQYEQELFDHLLLAGAEAPPLTYAELTR